MDRRQFIRTGLFTGGITAFGPGFWKAAWAQPAVPGESPYGPMSDVPDANGIRLPEGFTSRVVAVSGERVAGSDYEWHMWPDGGATYPTDDGGWLYVSNSELPNWRGGVGVLRFDPGGEVLDAYSILTATKMNCAGGPTPWGTWLSCEEYDLHEFPEIAEGNPIAGQVWECDPHQPGEGEVRPAMGLFQHEAAAVDPEAEWVYLTEDQPDGLFYRFTPSSYPDLGDGLLEAAVFDGPARLTWAPVPDPAAAEEPTRRQVPEAAVFNGGEGIWYDSGFVYFTTKGDDRVHALECATDAYELIYDGVATDGPLRGVDNITVETGTGDLYVAEDGGDMEVVLITADRTVAPFLHVTGQELSELAGPAFTPDGERLYVSSQRGNGGDGITYEISGPFRGAGMGQVDEDTPAPPTTLAEAAGATTGGGDSGPGALPFVAGGAAVVAGATGAAVWRLRTRRS